jgi:hypothetical protein
MRGVNVVAPPLSYDRCAEHVEDMMGQGIPFGDVEDAIDAAELLSELKAALWLLAWSFRSPALQREDAREMATWFGAGTQGPAMTDSRGTASRGVRVS